MKVISFINMKGGVGKSTVAINVAHCLSERNEKRVLIIDIDPQFNATQCVLTPDAYIKHMESGGDTICTVFNPERVVVNSVNGSSVVKPKELEDIKPIKIGGNLDLLPGSLELHRIEVSAGSGLEFKLRRYLDSVRESYDYVLVDTPPTPSIWMYSALIASDFYIIPVKPEPLSITGIDLLESIIEDKKKNFALKIKCLGLVLNLVEEHTITYRKTMEFLEGSDKWRGLIFRSFIPKRTAISKGQTSAVHILKLKDRALHMKLVRVVDELKEKAS